MYVVQYVRHHHFDSSRTASYHIALKKCEVMEDVLSFVLIKSNVCFQRVFSGVGLRSVFLSDLYPDEHYSVKVRCGAQQNFWKWGNWSKLSSFKTKTYGKLFICGVAYFGRIRDASVYYFLILSISNFLVINCWVSA